MINDRDMNVLSMFCLNALSEDAKSHPHFRRSHYLNDDNTGKNKDGTRNFGNSNSQISNGMFKDSSHRRDSASSNNSKIGNNSIFNRINYLLMNCKQKIDQPEAMQDLTQRDKEMDDLLITLI